MEEMVLFFKSTHPLSNWYPCKFTVKGVEFNCNEQFMMYCKAKLFGDEDAAARILAASGPAEQKAIGRKVKNFNQAKWDEKGLNYVVAGALAKFQQNPELKSYILSTGDRVLVEASPYDCIWGVGLGENDLRIFNPSKWRGKNLLGYALMEVRKQLMEASETSNQTTTH